MGNFNAIIDQNLDKHGGAYKTPKQNPMIQSIQHFNYIDTFQELNTDKKSSHEIIEAMVLTM